ncbi:DUF4461 domain-containing protein [Lactobacillus johnsonii]|jgi:hypothetical protein|uniref:DUF4461 domain-containing protein n=1 Tax=Lactobacillus johnsonii TaxID=33959 RepID=A0A9X7XV48_LACJH|nr:DUF4461 domain-containing protein [Lactobacillus johnsonii]QIA88625.1 DUF4461 domain-containing protein [Lactobacillus johnsonii]
MNNEIQKDVLIQKHFRLFKQDLNRINKLKKDKYFLRNNGDVIRFLLDSYDKLQEVEKDFKELQRNQIQLKSQNKQLSRMEIALYELLFVKGIGNKTFRGYDTYKEPLDKAVDRIIKNSQERLATNSVRDRKEENRFDDLFR